MLWGTVQVLEKRYISAVHLLSVTVGVVNLPEPLKHYTCMDAKRAQPSTMGKSCLDFVWLSAKARN